MAACGKGAPKRIPGLLIRWRDHGRRDLRKKPGDSRKLSHWQGRRRREFPVASILIAAPLRPVILAFYDFVRAGDDVADHPTLPPEQKRALLDQLDHSLIGASDAEPLGVKLREKLAERSTSPIAMRATCSTPSAWMSTRAATKTGTN